MNKLQSRVDGERPPSAIGCFQAFRIFVSNINEHQPLFKTWRECVQFIVPEVAVRTLR